MAILNFSDVLKNVGLDPKDVKLIRHVLSDERFRECYKAGMAHEYTQHQKDGFSKGYSYWITFISDGGTYARLHSCYRVNGSVPDTPDVCPAGLPDCEAMEYRGEMAFFDLQYVDLLKEYEGKLVIDWGGSARMWHQKATTEKPIVAIESKNQKPFVGFENLILLRHPFLLWQVFLAWENCMPDILQSYDDFEENQFNESISLDMGLYHAMGNICLFCLKREKKWETINILRLWELPIAPQ